MKSIHSALSFCVFFIAFVGVFPLRAQTPTEQAAIQLLFQKAYGNASQGFGQALRENPQSTIAQFGMAKSLLGMHTDIMAQEAYRNKYKNFEQHFQWLKNAHKYASLASDGYKKLTSAQQDMVRKSFSSTNDHISFQFTAEIQKEAFMLITNAPYRKNIFMLYKSQVYDRVADADTVEALREVLVQQCEDFMANYPGSPYAERITFYKKEMLQEYTNVQSLRQFGDRAGAGYEKFCDIIIEQYPAEELKHIVPQFYGSEYGFDETNYLTHPNYKKLQELAKANSCEVIDLLCRLNMHYGGVTEDNKGLYDQFVRKMAPADIAYIAVQRLAADFITNANWRAAYEVFQTYKPLFPTDERFPKVMATLKEPMEERRLRNLGPNINSPTNEYSPVLSLDGKQLYFTRKNGETGEDIYEAIRGDNGWQPAKRLNHEVNTRTHEIPLSLNPKGNLLFIYGNYTNLQDFFHVNRTESRLGKGDIYTSERTWRGWINLDAMKFPINTPNYEADLSMTADGKAVLFVSDRDGAVGGYNPNYPPNKLYYHGAGEFNLDIYVSVKKPDGTWGEPINLGKTINTPYSERRPFLHPDGKSLYFTSDGHYGLGGYDIFMSKRLREDSWTEWSTPMNIGKTMNSPRDDSFYITALGTSALVVSAQKDALGGTDIYEIVVPEKYRPEPVAVISGQIQTLEGKPLEANIQWEEEGNPTNKGVVKSDAEDGGYQIQFKGGAKYVYYADHRDYFGTSVSVDLMDPKEVKVSDKGLEVASFKKASGGAPLPFVMKTLHFDHNSDRIREESFYDLNRLADMLKRNPQVKLRIEGHTDSDGNDAFNLDLSNRRAQSVKTYLEQKGCTPARLHAAGFGEGRPKATNATEEGKQLNRRVEFFVE